MKAWLNKWLPTAMILGTTTIFLFQNHGQRGIEKEVHSRMIVCLENLRNSMDQGQNHVMDALSQLNGLDGIGVIKTEKKVPREEIENKVTDSEDSRAVEKIRAEPESDLMETMLVSLPKDMTPMDLLKMDARNFLGNKRFHQTGATVDPAVELQISSILTKTRNRVMELNNELLVREFSLADRMEAQGEYIDYPPDAELVPAERGQITAAKMLPDNVMRLFYFVPGLHDEIYEIEKLKEDVAVEGLNLALGQLPVPTDEKE